MLSLFCAYLCNSPYRGVHTLDNGSDCRYVSDCRSRGLSLIWAQSHTFGEFDHEIIFTAILLPSTDLRRVVVSNKRKYVHKVLVNRLVKLAQVVRLHDHSC